MQAILRRALPRKALSIPSRSTATTLGLRFFTHSARRLDKLPQATLQRTGPSKPMEGRGDDPRPQWIYVGSRLVFAVVIPLVGLYSILFYDFGDREHVFSPIRRWAFTHFNSAVALSPAEERFVESATANEKTTSTPSS